ncbi:hypothetical protein BH18VER2_BH18VER2_07660 [soil metagenome]
MKIKITKSSEFFRAFFGAKGTAIALVGAALLAWPVAAFSEIPRGVYSVANVSSDPVSRTLTNPDVDGISLRQEWSTLEPTEGNFDFTYLDGAVALCAQYGKNVLIRIGTQQSKPAWVTTAVKNARGKFFTFLDDGVKTKIPVFWDPTFVAKKKNMINALGAHFTNHPSVKIIAVSFANATSEDWNVPHTPSDITAWLRVGYSTALMTATGATMITTTMNAFPNQFVTLAVGGDGTLDLPFAEDYVARTAITSARLLYGERMIAQRNNLSADIVDAPGTGTLYEMIWDFRPEVAGQMVGLCLNSTVCGVGLSSHDALMASINKALGYEEKYVEIYQSDVNYFPDVITYAHNALNDQ